jgi:hypothetical protein
LVSNLKTKMATIALLAMTLIALSIPVMATVCQYGSNEAAKECTVPDEIGDICTPDAVFALEETPACDEGTDVACEDPQAEECEVVDELPVNDGCGAVTIATEQAPCANIAVYKEEAACDDSQCDTVTEADPCTEVETQEPACPANTPCESVKTCPKICNGSKTNTCPKETATPHMPPCVPSMDY